MDNADVISRLGWLLYRLLSEVADGRWRMKRLALDVGLALYPEVAAFFVLLTAEAFAVVSVEQAVRLLEVGAGGSGR